MRLFIAFRKLLACAYSDAAGLVRTIMKAVEYIHGCGIVHRGMLLYTLINQR